MSCGGGNRFVCGIRRYEKHRNNVADKPSNTVLHNDNNKRLEELMAQRSLQDKGVFSYPPVPQIQHQHQYQQHQQQIRPSFHQSASNIIQNVPSNPFSLSPPSLSSQKQQKSVSNDVTNVNKGERIIDFDTYLNVD